MPEHSRYLGAVAGWVRLAGDGVLAGSGLNPLPQVADFVEDTAPDFHEKRTAALAPPSGQSLFCCTDEGLNLTSRYQRVVFTR